MGLKKEIIKAGLCWIPNKEKRRFLRKKWELKWHCLDIEPYAGYFDSVWHKHRGLLEDADKIDTLLLGDSHAQFGLVPFAFPEGMFAHNYAFNANSLYETFESLKFAASKCKNLKNVVLLCSFYNGGFSLIRGGDAWHCRILEKKIGMKFDFGLNPAFDSAFYDEIINGLSPRAGKVYCQGYDFVGLHVSPSTQKTRERVEHHFRIYRKYKNQLSLLDDIISFCEQKGIKIVLANSPVRSDYAAVLNELSQGEDTLSDIRQAAGKHGVALLDPTGFADDDFSDSDHLNFNGALKLTRQLAALL
ncbi:MAG: hypothetical protein J5787_00325 [Alphaproteobacteria bacterium]|nr:hypothetical protein [Alphaproteobacteria bacterium]